MKKSFILYIVLALACISSAAIYNSYEQGTLETAPTALTSIAIKAKQNPLDPIAVEMLRDLKSASKKIAKMKEYKFDNKIDITVSDSTGTVSETTSSSTSMAKKGNNFFHVQGNVKKLQNEEYNVLVIPDEKIVVVNSPDKSMEDYLDFYNSKKNLDSFAANMENISKQVSAAGEKSYSYNFGGNKSVRHTVTLGIDGMIKSITTTKPLYIEKTGNTLVSTTTYSCNSAALDANDLTALDLENTIISKGKKLSLSKQYSGYTLHDNRMKK